MKRFWPISVLLLLALLAACGRDYQSQPQDGYAFYYLDESENAQSTIGSESRVVSDESLGGLIAQYMKGPEKSGLSSPFPVGTQVVGYKNEDDTLTLNMCEAYSQLTGAEKTMAEACLTLTFTSLEDVKALTIVESSGAFVTRTADMYLLQEDQEAVADERITVYFADAGKQYLVPETLGIISGKNQSAERYIIDQLIKGPNEKDLSPVIPQGTELNSISIQNGVCTVDFSAAFLENKPETEREELITIYAIVNSLTSLESIQSVQITVDGIKPEIFRYIMLSAPLTVYEGIIGPVRTSLNEIAVTLYVKGWSPDYLAGLPDIVKRRVNVTTEEQLLKLLLDFEPPGGYTNPIPKGTKINAVAVTDGVCTVDLSREFITGNSASAEDQRLSALSIAATLSQMDYIDSVQILIDGEAESLPYFDLSGPITVGGDVFFP